MCLSFRCNYVLKKDECVASSRAVVRKSARCGRLIPAPSVPAATRDSIEGCSITDGHGLLTDGMFEPAEECQYSARHLHDGWEQLTDRAGISLAAGLQPSLEARPQKRQRYTEHGYTHSDYANDCFDRQIA
jgi:hypothetical protein